MSTTCEQTTKPVEQVLYSIGRHVRLFCGNRTLIATGSPVFFSRPFFTTAKPARSGTLHELAVAAPLMHVTQTKHHPNPAHRPRRLSRQPRSVLGSLAPSLRGSSRELRSRVAHASPQRSTRQTPPTARSLSCLNIQRARTICMQLWRLALGHAFGGKRAAAAPFCPKLEGRRRGEERQLRHRA